MVVFRQQAISNLDKVSSRKLMALRELPEYDMVASEVAMVTKAMECVVMAQRYDKNL